MIKIQVVNRGHQQLPAYATPQSAGMDLRANLDAPITLHPMERRLIPTGLHIALPEGYEAQVRPRSGLALKHGLTVLNTPGTIDADYRGEIGVVLINLSQEDFVVNDGERIAQMVIARHEQGDFVVVVKVVTDTQALNEEVGLHNRTAVCHGHQCCGARRHCKALRCFLLGCYLSA